MLMKEYAINLSFVEGEFNVLYIENQRDYRYILHNLWKQVNGETGDIILSEKEKELKIDKEVIVIFNPFSLDCNERRVITKLYQELKGNVEVSYIQETVQLQSEILKYLDIVLGSVPYPIKFNLDLNLLEFFKMTGLKNEDISSSLLEKVVEYIRVMSQLCHMRIFVFIGMKSFFQNTEIRQLYEYCAYNKIYLIDIETKYECRLENEKVWIIDRDSCIIEVN